LRSRSRESFMMCASLARSSQLDTARPLFSFIEGTHRAYLEPRLSLAFSAVPRFGFLQQQSEQR
jgi:hypothetical protein